MSASNNDIAATTGEAVQDNEYTSRTGQKEAMVPVQSDNDPVEDPIDGATADSDAQLRKLILLHIIWNLTDANVREG